MAILLLAVVARSALSNDTKSNAVTTSSASAVTASDDGDYSDYGDYEDCSSWSPSYRKGYK
jgi:hypothetical protein